MPKDAKKSATPDEVVQQLVEAALGPARTSTDVRLMGAMAPLSL